MASRAIVLCTVVLVCACGTREQLAETTPSSSPPAEAATSDGATTPGGPASKPAKAMKARYRKRGGNVREGDRAVELSNVVDENGQRVSLESLSAPILVLTFGASWCAPCKKELPALEKLASTYDPGQVAFVAVNIDSTIAAGKAFMKRSGLRHVKAVFDPKSASVGSYDPPTMPSLFIVNQGIVKVVHAGYRNGDDDKIKKAIDAELQ